MSLAELAEQVWYGDSQHSLRRVLLPLSWLYCAIAWLRARYWRWRQTLRPANVGGASVIVIGNLTVGGTGKTPLVLWMVEHLRARGWRPGILTRGYRGQPTQHPRLVPPAGDARDYGDEPVLLATRSLCPVMAGRDRLGAARQLVADHGCDILVADDGLQHYRLPRQLEILLIDGRRQFGNRRCLPAGPLREPVSRAQHADLCLTNGGTGTDGYWMTMRPEPAVNLVDSRQTRALAQFTGQTLTAVAGIGNPEQFFGLLEHHGLRIIRQPYPDHYAFGPDDVQDWAIGPILMTEKDAVKCRGFAPKNAWYLPVSAEPNPEFIRALEPYLVDLESARQRQETAA